MAKDSLTIVDNRSGLSREIPIEEGAIPASALGSFHATEGDPGLISYDPGFQHTALCQSRITFIDGARGVFRIHGYPIEQLADRSNFLETSFLILYGELPKTSDYEIWVRDITLHTIVHENVKDLMAGFRYDAPPMGMMVSTVSALSTFYPEAKDVRDPESRKKQIVRLIAKLPTLAAFAYRHAKGLPYVYPDNDLSYCGNFLQMMFRVTELHYEVHPVLERALNVLLVLQADDAQDCSSLVMRTVGSAGADPFSATAAAMATVNGPLHGGLWEKVLRMLAAIGSKAKVPAFVQEVRRMTDPVDLAGFGHPVFHGLDPRARIARVTTQQVLEAVGTNPLVETGLELERLALDDEFFAERKLVPNVDFYSALIYHAMGFPAEMFPVLLAIGRTAGWLGQWQELLLDPVQPMAESRQIYVGPKGRDYVPFEARS